MEAKASERLPIVSGDDVVRVRQAVRAKAVAHGWNIVEQTKLVTASSELARNTLDYGGGGFVLMETVQNGVKTGIRLTFEDQGPGIADIAAALKDGFTTGGGMGHGLGGAKRLSHEFEIQSEPGKGTRVSIVRWKGI